MTDRGLLARVPGATTSADGTRSRTRLASRVLTDWRTTLRRHWLFAIILGLGLALRVVTWLAYQPAMMYIDSFRYVPNLFSWHMDGLDPIGYTVIIWPFMFGGKLLLGAGMAFTTALQHLLGMAIAVVLYWMSRRLGAPRWLAAIITIPVLLDAYQLQMEQNLMAEVWSDAFMLAALWFLIAWRLRRDSRVGEQADQPSRVRRFVGPLWWQAGIAGLLIGANVPVRIIGMMAIIPVVAYLILVGARWRDRQWWRVMLIRVAAGVAGFSIMFGGYLVAYRVSSGHPGLGGGGGDVIYGRAAPVAKCDELPLDKYLKQVCPKEPLGHRLGVDRYAHDPMEVNELPPGVTLRQLRAQFGRIVLKHQPLDVAGAIVRDFLKGFAWTKTGAPEDTPIKRWQFQIDYPRWEATDANRWTLYFDGTTPHVIKPFTRFLRAYQLGGGYTPGTLLAVAGVVGIAGALVRRGPGIRSLRAESMLAVGIPLAVLGGSAAFEFSWRYQLPGLVFFPLAGAIGFAALTVRERSPMKAYPDDIDQMAVQGFEDRYGKVEFPELVVVIAAYNEERGIGAVLDRMPKTCPTPDGRELRLATLVVIDGSTDRTAEIVDEHGAYACVAPVNRGQGSALRLGYHLAAEHGATYIVTTDADGQYDIDELPKLIRPVLTDEADFVTGSRRLGTGEYDSNVRWVGVRVFATLASILTRTKITDTSFGFRAMRAEVARGAVLTEPQYQASELLLGVMARGARMVEVPLSMRLRNNGASKKGGSITYGANYARVMITTWLREWVASGDNRKLRKLASSHPQRWRKTILSNSVNLKKNTAP
jgi:glycosyltransferase involved in cell wall biosynthesis